MSYVSQNPNFQFFPVDSFAGDGNQTVFVLKRNVLGRNSILVWVDGLKLYTDAYDVNGDLLTIYNPPATPTVAGKKNVEVFYLNAPSDSGFQVGAVTSVDAQIQGALNQALQITGVPILSTGTMILEFIPSVTSFQVGLGGTGRTTLPVNQLLLGNGTGAVNSVIDGSATVNQALLFKGGGVVPAWGNVVNSIYRGNSGFGPAVATSGDITLDGTLNVQNGGTGVTSLSANQLVLGNGVLPVTTLANGAAGQALVSTGPTTAPVWQQLLRGAAAIEVGSIFLGQLPAGTSLAQGQSFTSSAVAQIIWYGTGTAPQLPVPDGTYLMLGAINTTEEALFVRTA